MKCEKCNQSELWYFDRATNENGWRCGECDHKPGEPAGFCPQLDRDEIEAKVMCLLMDLHDNKFVYISNSDEGDYVSEQIAAECRELGLFDQYTICRLLFAADSSHGTYWKKISEGVLSGNDQRHRCPCGALSTCSSSKGDGTWEYRCSQHIRQEF